MSTAKVTCRKGRREVHLGPLEIEPVSGGPSVQVNVTEVRHKRLRNVTDSEAQADGFADAKAMLDGMLPYYPGITGDDEVTLIFWE